MMMEVVFAACLPCPDFLVSRMVEVTPVWQRERFKFLSVVMDGWIFHLQAVPPYEKPRVVFKRKFL